MLILHYCFPATASAGSTAAFVAYTAGFAADSAAAVALLLY